MRAVLAALLGSLALAAPASADLMADVRHYAALGPVNHLTGSASDARTLTWIRDELRRAGLTTGEDGYTFYAFRVRKATLRIDGKSLLVAPYLYSGVTGPGGRTAPLVDAGYGTSCSGCEGRIAVVRVKHGPSNSVNVNLNRASTTMEGAGAVGMIAVTDGPEDLPVNEDVDSRAGTRRLPTLFVGAQTGQRAIDAAAAGKSATLVLDAETGRRCTANVWGSLPGADPSRTIVIGTPTGAFTPSASERGSGVAVLLARARHYAALPRAQRPLSLLFAALSGHELGYLGLPMLMQTRQKAFASADAYVHLGASLGAAFQSAQTGRTTQGDPTRALYISENALLQAGTAPAFAGAQPIGSVPPGVLDPGEQGYAYHEGIPIVASSGASYYFHTAGDTVQAVEPSLLAGMAQGFQGSIDWIASLPPGALLAANGAAARLGAAGEPNPTPGAAEPGGSVQLPKADPGCGV